MATPITNQKSASMKYKFGDDELDLNDYIRNLNHNYQSYVNSQNWNEGQRQEFRSAYDNFLKGLQDQLANNTSRFSTDFSGSIIDSTGQLSNTDNDDIDPVGSEYYYNDKGDRITTDDLNTLRKRQQKKYSTFSANRQVATFFNKVGTALRDARKNKPATQNQSNAFNLSKHGFLANWETANNPAGGEFNLNPYLEKDTLDETTGLRSTTNRAAYLKEQIENYLNNIGDYDFSGTPFKDREAYISKLRAAADNLGNGYNSEDVIALNQAGIGNKFLGSFFSTGSTDKPKTEAEQAAEDIVKMQQAEQNAELVKQRDQMQYEQERNKYFSDYLSQNPFQSSIQGTVLTPSYNWESMNVAAADKFKADKTNLASMQHAIKSYINFPQLASFIRGKNKMNVSGQDTTQAHIANNLDWAYKSNLLTDRVGDSDYYIVPGSEDYQNWSYLAYNPNTRQYQEQSMLLNEELKKRMAYAEYDKTKNKTKQETPKQENGGVLMFQDGGLAKWVEENKKKAQEAQQKAQNTQTKVKETGKTREQIEAGERKPSEDFSTIDKVRLSTAIADATAAAAAFVPGYGTAASGILGVGSTLTNVGTDIADDSMSAGDVIKNAAFGLGMDIVGLIPGWGASGKAAKIVRILKPVSKLVMRSLQGYGMVQSAGAFSKLMSNPSDMSADDWRNIITGLQTIGGEARYRGAKIANKRELSRQQSATPYKTIVTESGNTVKLSPEQFNKVRKASGIDAQNRALQEIAPGEKLGKEFITGKLNRLRHPLRQNPETGSGVDYDSQDWSKVRYLPIGYKVKDGQVKPRVLSNAWISEKQGYGVLGDERFSWFKRKENPLYKPEKVKSKRDKIDESIQKYFDTNPNYVFRKEGGTIDLVKIRKFQNAGKFPEWYSKSSRIDVKAPQPKADGNREISSIFNKLSPTITYGMPRAVYADRMNREITDLSKKSVVPLLYKDSVDIPRYTRSDLDAEMQGERNYVSFKRLASPTTSDGYLQTAAQFQSEVQGQEARTAGKEKSNQVGRYYDELAWKQNKENAANRHEKEMLNTAQLWNANKTKNAFEQAYLYKKATNWDVFGQQLEYDAKVKQKENKALEDNFAKSDIHNAISYTPNNYGANLTPDELTVWNKVLSGTDPSSLPSKEEFNSYKLALQKVSRAETNQLRQYYDIPDTRWSGKTPSTSWSPTISKAISAKNGAKIAIAGIKAKTSDAERFQKQIKETIDRNEKALDRLSKSLYGIIKASMIK